MRRVQRGRSSTSASHDLTRKVGRRCRSGFIAIAAASALVNILYLTSSFFMLQVYDRVIPSRSIASLVALAILAALLYLFQAAFDIARSRILVRIAGVFDEVMARHVFRTTIQSTLKMKPTGDGLQLVRDFDQIRTFLSTSGPSTLFDLPWIPLYVGICFLFHPIIGIMTISGGAILALLTFAANRSSHRSSRRIFELGNNRTASIQAAQRNAEVVHALGMSDALAERWLLQNNVYRASYEQNSDVANTYSAFSKVFRLVLQSAVLAAGAVLVIENQASGGIIIASSILTSRALAPVEQAISNSRGYAAALQAWRRMKELLNAFSEPPFPLLLPAPKGSLTVENLVSGAPGQNQPLISGVSFAVRAGSAVGVVGPSASGKSTLARTLTGVWPIYRGSIRLDGAALDQWDAAEIGSHIGYLPQDIELFAGTVAENISRFQRNPAAEDIIAAAIAAGVHDLILRLPNGYETEIGAGGSMLSAGQRQRIGLARALYGDPFLVVLDEPNSNLDAQGEAAVAAAIRGIRDRGGIAIVVAHRPSALSGVDNILMIKDGQLQMFGTKDEVLNNVLRKQVRPVTLERTSSLKVVDAVQEQHG